ncbi:MAG: amidohydrolase family protein [Gammaproteobacteria bacterium]|nr:amidohydrolase family protein [Gammaproteobacteria bacterium]
MSITISVLRDIDWLVAFDGERHVYIRDADLAFAVDARHGSRILHAGPGYAGPVDEELSGRGRLVMPGLVNIHSHPSSEPLRKGITDETRSPGFHHSSLYEFLTVFDTEPAARTASLQVALCELLLSGCTTVTDVSMPYEGWLDTIAASGMRAVLAPVFRDARWFTRNGHALEYEWDEHAGGEALARAVGVIDAVQARNDSRLGAMVFPGQIDTCTPERLQASFRLACERDLPWQTHASQSVAEFNEMQRRHGLSPVQLLDRLGILSERSIIAHAIFLDHHPWLHWTSRRDLGLLADSGTSVAHCPTVFSRRGIALHSFGGYVRGGINLGIGTDTYPHNMLEELKTVGTCARLIAQSVDDHDTREVFEAATLGGARALRRDDLGRLAVGAKADFVCVDLTHASMRPLREPLRTLIGIAQDRAVDEVWVDGRCLVRGGTVLSMDLQASLGVLQDAQQRSLSRTRQLDWAGRSADELAPMLLQQR